MLSRTGDEPTAGGRFLRDVAGKLGYESRQEISTKLQALDLAYRELVSAVAAAAWADGVQAAGSAIFDALDGKSPEYQTARGALHSEASDVDVARVEAAVSAVNRCLFELGADGRWSRKEDLPRPADRDQMREELEFQARYFLHRWDAG